MARTRHDLTTIAREALREDGVSFDGLPSAKRIMLLGAAEDADRAHQDAHAAVAECWREIVDEIRQDAAEELRGPHR